MAYALLLFVPVSVTLRYLFDARPLWVFVTSLVAIAVLADWLRRATEQLAERAGSTIGGLLNVSFGNIAELMLALFILRQAEIRVVQAQITGSIIGTTLLFLGISAMVGGFGRARQTFSQASAGLLSTLLFLVVVAILLPAVFDLTERTAAPGADISMTDEELSLGVAVVLLLLYAGNLVYTLVTSGCFRRRSAQRCGQMERCPGSGRHDCRHRLDRDRGRARLDRARGGLDTT